MKIVRYLFLILFLGTIVISNVNASRSICMYVVGDSTITVNYDYTKSPTYSISGGVNSSKTKVEEVKDLKNDQFYKDGKLVCPNLNLVSRRSHDKHKYTYTLSPIGEAKYGSAEGTISVLENDGAENGGQIVDDDIDCIYKKGTSSQYTLRWENNKVVADLTGTTYVNYCKDDTTIKQEGFSASDFENGKCPDVYDQIVAKHQNLSSTCKGKLIISKSPILTQNDTITENNNNESGGNIDDQLKTTIRHFEFCTEDGVLKAFKIVGYMLVFIKILVPLLLIIFGVIDFSKAVIASDDKAINKATQMLVIRVVAGIIIFFIPSIINAVTGLISKWSDVESNFTKCSTCLFKTSDCDNKFLENVCTSKPSINYNDGTTMCTYTWNSKNNKCLCKDK